MAKFHLKIPSLSRPLASRYSIAFVNTLGIPPVRKKRPESETPNTLLITPVTV